MYDRVQTRTLARGRARQFSIHSRSGKNLSPFPLAGRAAGLEHAPKRPLALRGIALRRRKIGFDLTVSLAGPQKYRTMKLHWTFVTAVIGLLAGETILLLAAPSGEKTEQRAPQSEGWKLVWADEFDKDGPPDPRNWTYETGFVRAKEYQWYQPDNARCQDGLLVIEGRSERKPNPSYEPNSKDWRKKREYADYTSASLTTEGLHSWQYGRFEMRDRK